MLLMGNQTAGHFGIGFRRQHGLRTFSRITAPNTTHIERRTATIPLNRTVSFLSFQSTYTDSLFITFLIKRNFRQHPTFFLRQFFHFIIKTRNGDAPVFVSHTSQQTAQYINRISYRSTEMAGMQITIRPRHLDFPISQSSQPRRKRRKVGREHAGVAH